MRAVIVAVTVNFISLCLPVVCAMLPLREEEERKKERDGKGKERETKCHVNTSSGCLNHSSYMKSFRLRTREREEKERAKVTKNTARGVTRKHKHTPIGAVVRHMALGERGGPKKSEEKT